MAGDSSVIYGQSKKREGGNREIASFPSHLPPLPQQALKWWLKDYFLILDLQGEETFYLLYIKESMVLQQPSL